MTMTSISLHGISDITIQHHLPNVGNAITLNLHRKDADMVCLTLFDMPQQITDMLMDAFGDDGTDIDRRIADEFYPHPKVLKPDESTEAEIERSQTRLANLFGEDWLNDCA